MVGISEKNLSFKVVFEQIQKKGFAKLMLCGLTAKMKEYFEQNAPVMGLVCSVIKVNTKITKKGNIIFTNLGNNNHPQELLTFSI